MFYTIMQYMGVTALNIFLFIVFKLVNIEWFLPKLAFVLSAEKADYLVKT